MPQQRRFIQCGVFSDHPTKGNALAVVLDVNDLSDEVNGRMHRKPSKVIQGQVFSIGTSIILVEGMVYL